MVDVDLVVVGSGPVGLYATYYAGFRGMRTAIVDSLPEPGGQISALYPEKLIYDIAGLPAVRGRDLVAGLARPGQHVHAALAPRPVGGAPGTAADGRLRILTTTGTEVTTRSIVLAAGIGTFTPRPLPVGGSSSAGASTTSSPIRPRTPDITCSSSAAATAPSTGR